MSEPSEWVTDLKGTFLECSVCLCEYNQTDKRARLLVECLHAFCTECLDKLLQKEGRGQLTCPICRHVVKVKGKAASLPADLLRSKLVDFVKMKKEKKAMCTDCPDGHQADSRCQECSLFLCKVCRFVHKRHKMTSNHSVQSLEQVLEQPLKQLSTRHFCTKHPNHQLEFFCCTDESLCCLSCTVLDHQGHKFQKIEEALIPRQQELDSLLQEKHTLAISLKEQRQNVENNKAHILEDKMKVTTTIQQKFSKLEKIIQQRKESLIEEVEQSSQEKLAFCNKNIQAIDETLATIESTQTYICQANQNSDAVEMLQMLPALKQSLLGSSHPSSLGAEQTPRIVFDPRFMVTAEKMIPLIGLLEVQSEAGQPSGAREYRDCVQQVMSACLNSRNMTELRKKINQHLGEEEQQAGLGSGQKRTNTKGIASSFHGKKLLESNPVKNDEKIPGTMTSALVQESCDGYENCNSIQIHYHIPAGSTSRRRQSPAHRYDEVDITAYLPNNEEGQKVLSLLKVAWQRGLTFKLEGGTWRLQIWHKEDRNPLCFFLKYSAIDFYPDRYYLQKVQEELRRLGVTEEDI